MRATLRWVIWDVKDTLLKVRASVGEQYCKEAERVGLNLSPVEVDAAFRQAYQHHSSRYPNYGITQGLDGRSWWMKVVRDTFCQCRVFPDSKKTLERCTSLGLKLGVVSNFDSRLEEILRVCGLLSHFRFLITSEDAGIAKPSPAIFDQALQKCGVVAANVAHIGDHYVNDYLASRSVGIHGFLLDRHNKHKQPDVPQEHRLSSLEELPSLLQQHMH
ncbi:haloacid dehalogenase-like hydrolase domain-containing protein 3 isoform X2 [Cyclopterus lumpus]|uniref:haloacid dehalogenase-like hydrolase domain-containing protein 3 isoform X2 n=1 Tax=Cyclopterus lumpus TaxID=8103 RepID=UPI0014871B61|nr:haloacid dehalogenase-like hydrolase domain-containing protein 3 isoform X2 [Cyclopterus lumpus]